MITYNSLDLFSCLWSRLARSCFPLSKRCLINADQPRELFLRYPLEHPISPLFLQQAQIKPTPANMVSNSRKRLRIGFGMGFPEITP